MGYTFSLSRVNLNNDLDLNTRNDNLANSNENGRIAQKVRTPAMKSYNNIYNEIVLKENLVLT